MAAWVAIQSKNWITVLVFLEFSCFPVISCLKLRWGLAIWSHLLLCRHTNTPLQHEVCFYFLFISFSVSSGGMVYCAAVTYKFPGALYRLFCGLLDILRLKCWCSLSTYQCIEASVDFSWYFHFELMSAYDPPLQLLMSSLLTYLAPKLSKIRYWAGLLLYLHNLEVCAIY